MERAEILIYDKNDKPQRVPMNCTILDVAYINSMSMYTGNHCVGAKVNGKDRSIAYCISPGDKIEILTRPEQKPQYEWFQIAKIESVRVYLKSFRTQLKQEYEVRMEEERTKEKIVKNLLSEKDYFEDSFPTEEKLEKLPPKRLLGILQKIRAKISSIQNYYGPRYCDGREYIGYDWYEDVQQFADIYIPYRNKVKTLLALQPNISKKFRRSGKNKNRNR